MWKLQRSGLERLTGLFQAYIHVARKKIQALPEPMTFWLLVQPCSTTELQELVVGKDTKLGSRDKHPAYC